MKLNLYCINDVVAVENGFSSPVAIENDGCALRMFKREMKNVPTEELVNYGLFCVGSFDTVTGVILSCEPIKIFPLEEKPTEEKE